MDASGSGTKQTLMNNLSPDHILIGVDIGGTNTIVAAISPGGEVLSRATMATRPGDGPDAAVRRIVDLIRQAQQGAGEKPLAGVGIGCTGPVDRQTGHIHNPYTLPTWDDFPLTDALQRELSVPVVIENDADAGALGEHWQGAGRGVKHMVYVTIGTGVGGGIVLDGRLYNGANGLTGEIGHLPITAGSGPLCYCGIHGCLESLVAAPALSSQARDGVRQTDSLIRSLVGGDLSLITPQVIAEAARQGDELGRQIINGAAHALGLGLRGLIVTLAPEMIVLGGGIMDSFDLFLPGIRVVVDGLHLPTDYVRIVHAKLGLNAGVVGGARAVLDRCFPRLPYSITAS
jgi:glucokinase